jgi:microsomal dipeptidase-like Zn-dependent dipeptidase
VSRRRVRHLLATAVLLVALVASVVPVGAAASPVDRAAPAATTELAEAAADRPPSVWPRETRAEFPEDRYAMAGGCYVVYAHGPGAYLARAGDGFAATAADPTSAEPFHLKATDLGRYLLYGTAEDHLAADDGLLGELLGAVTDTSVAAALEGLSQGLTGTIAQRLSDGLLGTATGRGAGVGAADAPSELADWRVDPVGDAYQLVLPVFPAALVAAEDGSLSLADPEEAGTSARFTFRRAEGCASWPEVEVNVEGPIQRGDTAFEETRGYLDAHLHGMAFEFLGGRARCGRPWHPYGVEHALKGCDEHELAGGRTHVLETALSGADPVAGHDTTGWPTFAYWPAHQSLTYEQTYHRWLERAWRSGLRMYVNLLVDNNKLCEVYPFRRNSCNEMDGVRLQAQRLREFERYIDAQHGGPGRGWLRIVTDPFEARRVVNEGKLAVVMGIEVSRLFDCQIVRGQPTCDEEQIDRQLAEVHDLGVRQMELVNKFDNAFSGVAGDAGETGLLVGGANLLETGSFWRMAPCEDVHEHDHTHAQDRRQLNLGDDAGVPDGLVGRDALAGQVLAAFGSTGAAPIYPPGPHCNTMGLTDLGAYLLERMVERGMLFDPDHMSAVARHEALDLMEEWGYSGVVSSHSWADEVIYDRILDLGGVVTPMAGSSPGFAATWRDHRRWADDRFYYGYGFGSDINGFATQGAPRGPDVEDPVTYPFEGLGGVVIDRQVSGERIYDINVDGVAHYGLYPDWIEDLRRQAGDAIVEDLARGVEAYLQMWERALGVFPDSCREDVPALDAGELDALVGGMTPEQVVTTLGQPRERRGSTFTYCGADGVVQLTFDEAGRLVRAGNDPGAEPPAIGPERGRSGDAPGRQDARPGRGKGEPPRWGSAGHAPQHAPSEQPAADVTRRRQTHGHGEGDRHAHAHVHPAGDATLAANAAAPVGAGHGALFVLGLAGLVVHVLRLRREDAPPTR